MWSFYVPQKNNQLAVSTNKLSGKRSLPCFLFSKLEPISFRLEEAAWTHLQHWHPLPLFPQVFPLFPTVTQASSLLTFPNQITLSLSCEEGGEHVPVGAHTWLIQVTLVSPAPPAPPAPPPSPPSPRATCRSPVVSPKAGAQLSNGEGVGGEKGGRGGGGKGERAERWEGGGKEKEKYEKKEEEEKS